MDLGDRLPPAQAPNPKGFWEDQDLCGINCEMMHVLGSDWHHLAPLALDDMETQQEKYFLSKAAKLLYLKFSEGTIFGFKDPRTTKLLPFWKKVFLQCQLDVSCVLAIRHPLSVSQSLTKRDGFDAEKNYFLWLGHVIESLSGSDGLERVLVDYDKLMLSPKIEVRRLAEKLDLKIDEVELEIYSAGFLDRSLRHTIYSLDDLSKDDACPPLVREVYATLLEVAAGGNHLDDPALQDRMSCWIQEYERLKSILLLTDRISERNAIAALEASKFDKQITYLNQTVTAREEQSAALKSQIEDIYASTSWRLTRPMRAAKRLISPHVSKTAPNHPDQRDT